MPTFQKSCDQYQGYNFKKDAQTPVGFITALTIGDVEFKADQTVKKPTSSAEDLEVFAVLTGAMWELGPTDALYFSGQISTANQQQVKMLTYRDLTKVEVKVKFTVYEYDPKKDMLKYFECLQGSDDAELEGILEKNGSDLNLAIADDESTAVQSPKNFAFQIGIKPQPKEQKLTVATSFSDKIVKLWGITVK